MEIIHISAGNIMESQEETLLNVAERESNGESVNVQLEMTRPVLRGMISFTQRLQAYVYENL